MTTTIGASQTILAPTANNTTSQQSYYFTKFVSTPINQTSIAANTWTYNFAARTNVAGFTNYPVSGTNQPVRINVYVWRPSNSTKVGTILDGNTASTIDETASSDLKVCQATFSGSVVNSTQADDVIICEIWFVCTSQFANTNAMEFAYDGTTANTTKNATVTNHASFIETPETITFSGGTTPVSQTSIHKYSIRQYIAQTTIHKYNMRAYLAQTSIHKYTLRTFLAQTSIQKYNLRKFLAQTSIHKYNLKQLIPSTSIHKYSLRQFLAQTSIHKYNLRNFVAATASIHKYNLRKFLAATSIQKYNILFSGTVIATTIHKYNLRKYLAQTSIHKYTLRNVVAITASIHKYNLRKFLAQTSIQKYSMRAVVLQTSTHKYNLAGFAAPPVDMTQTNTKTYANKFIIKV